MSLIPYSRVKCVQVTYISVSFSLSAVSDAVGNLSCSGVSWDSIHLSWDLPSSPNGQIIFYEILVEMNLQSNTHQANSSEYMVTGLSPDQEYTLTVAAVNSAGPGDRINCTASTLSESGSQVLQCSLFIQAPLNI